MSEERIAYLVSKINNQTVTVAEREEFLKIMKEPAHEMAVKTELEKLLLSGEAEFIMDMDASKAVLEAILSAEGEGHKDAETRRGAKISGASLGNDLNHGDTGAQRGTEGGHEDAETRRGTKDTSLREDEEKEDTEVPSQAQEGERKVVRIWRWVAAAVVIGVMGLGVWWMISRNNTVEKPGVAVVPKAQDVAPGRQGAILTLSDGKQIVLDSAGNGALALEGKTSIVKQGGELRYEKSGAISSEEVVYNTMTTPKGRQYSLLLADGSKVWLNAASSIKFPTAFTGNTRVVEITGEAYFEVAHNAAKPFIVSVGDMQVEVLGTHFNINSYSDEPEIRTTLLEGKVRVTKGASIGILKPGQQARINSNNALSIEDANVDAVMAWKNGEFDFRSVELSEIMRQIARWYDLDVKYEGEPRHEKFSGIVSRKSNVSQVLKIMEAAGVKFRIKNKEITVLM